MQVFLSSMKVLSALYCIACIYFSSSTADANAVIRYSSYEDLSYPLDEDTLYLEKTDHFKSNPPRSTQIPEYGSLIFNSFSAGEHGGTHLDAPFHFNPDGWKITEIPTCHLLREGVIIDVQKKADNNPNYSLTSQDVKEWESVNGEIPEESVVLINFGWARHYLNKSFYLRSEKPPFRFPGISREAVEYLISKKITGIGSDVASVDSGRDKTSHVHKALAQNNIYNIENLALHNTHLPPKGFQLIILPLKLANASGAPTRVIALY